MNHNSKRWTIFLCLVKNYVGVWEWENLLWPDFDWPKDLLCQDALALLRPFPSSSGWQPRETSRACTTWGMSWFPLTNTTQTETSQHGTGVFPKIVYRSTGEHYHSLRQWLKVHCLMLKKIDIEDSLGSKQSENRLKRNYYRKIRN